MVQKNRRASRLALALATPLALVAGSQALAFQPGLDVSFDACSEFVGIAPVSLAQAQALVPAPFSIVDAGGVALLVVRISHCEAIRVGGGPPTPGTVAHTGVNIVPPDGAGDINNYTLTFASDVTALVNELRALGMPAQRDAGLRYEFSRDASTTGNLLGIVAPNPGPTWHVYGREGDPAPNSDFPFRAIWWSASPSGTVRMDTEFPAIAFGSAQVSLQTPGASVLTDLIGGDSIASFAALSVRGVFATAEMTVTVIP